MLHAGLSESVKYKQSMWNILLFHVSWRIYLAKFKPIFWRWKSLHLTTLDLFDFCFVEPQLDWVGRLQFYGYLEGSCKDSASAVCALLQRTLGNIQYHNGYFAEFMLVIFKSSSDLWLNNRENVLSRLEHLARMTRYEDWS